jgi:hypothetical protein
MAEKRTSLITLGLCEIQVGEASAKGTMPTTLNKIGKTYKDTCKIAQDAADVTEHYEEGMAAPEVRKKARKIPRLTFSIMDANVDDLVAYVGGEKINDTNWGYDGNEVVANKAIFVKTEQGLDFEIPNGDIEAVINADMSAKGIFLVDFTVTPMAVEAGKALRGIPKKTTATNG